MDLCSAAVIKIRMGFGIHVDRRRWVDNKIRVTGVLQNKFFKWCSSSLKGHLALFEVTCGIPLFLFSVLSMYVERSLTIASVLYMAVVCSVLVALGAGLFWYTFSKPLMKKRGAKL